MNLSENTKKEIISRKITIRELSRATGISCANISDILKGKVINPRINTVIKLAEVFDTTIDKLVGRNDLNGKK